MSDEQEPRRFRLVLDIEIDVTDPVKLRADADPLTEKDGELGVYSQPLDLAAGYIANHAVFQALLGSGVTPRSGGAIARLIRDGQYPEMTLPAVPAPE